MKILYLNAWNGKAGQAYLDYLKRYVDEYDIVCLQEVDAVEAHHRNIYDNMVGHYRLTVDILSASHYVYFAARQDFWSSETDVHHNDWGLMIAVRRSIPILEYREKYIMHHRNAGTKIDLTDLPVLVQAIRIKNAEDSPIWIVNFHGHYAGGFVGGNTVGKSDTPERIEQAHAVMDFVT